MAVSLTITNAAGTIRKVSPTAITFDRETRLTGTLTCTFIDNLDVYEQETSDANPVQLNAEVVLLRDLSLIHI